MKVLKQCISKAKSKNWIKFVTDCKISVKYFSEVWMMFYKKLSQCYIKEYKYKSAIMWFATVLVLNTSEMDNSLTWVHNFNIEKMKKVVKVIKIVVN